MEERKERNTGGKKKVRLDERKGSRLDDRKERGLDTERKESGRN
jgi:hypothetical protein